MKRVLVVDDDPGHRLMLRAVLESAGWEVDEAESPLEAFAALEHAIYQGMILDMRMPGMDGLSALRQIQLRWPDMPVVMLTAFGTVGSAVQAMKRGAFDFLTKPADNDQLIAVMEKALHFSQLIEENKNLRRRLDGEEDPVAAIVGISPAMQRVRDFILQAGPSEATVLIMGESGTGKELIAQALHAVSPRRAKPLIRINCAALPSQLLESELFGYQKGAFTGALRDKPGRFQMAYGGSIFLDEIGDMPVELQAKLLRTLQERIIEPLGALKPVPIDVRLIAATNHDLRKAVEVGAFREDLYFRLNVLEIVPPPLRERAEDLPVLISRLLEKLSRKNRREVKGVSAQFLDVLMRYSWPGNVRELENVLERALVLCQSDILTPDTLPPYILEQAEAFGAKQESLSALPDNGLSSLPLSLESAERLALQAALEANNNHREHTAEALGISRRTLQYKLKKLGLLSKKPALSSSSLPDQPDQPDGPGGSKKKGSDTKENAD